MDLIQLRDRVRSKAIQAGLTYSEIETLFDVNALLNQTMPCLMFNYEEESNDYESPFTEVTLRMYLITNLHDSEKIETGEYQRDYLLTAKNALRQKYIDFLTQFQTDESPYIEILRDRQLQLAERVSIEGFLIMEALPIVLVKRNYCLDESEHLPPTIPCDTLINGVVFATTAPVDFGGVYLPSGTLNGRNTYQHKTLTCKTIRYDFDAGFGGFLWIAECAISGNILYSDFPNDAMYPWGFLWQGEDLTSQATVSQACCNGGSTEPATWELRDTDGNVLQTGSIAAGGSAVIVAPDATATLNGNAFLTIPSSAAENIILQDQTSTQIVPSSVVGATVTVNLPRDLFIYTEIKGTTGSKDFAEWTSKAQQVGTINTITAGGVTSLVVKKNTTPVTTPFSIALNDVIRFEFDSTISDHTITLEGNYV
jgi:hypothetical protein